MKIVFLADVHWGARSQSPLFLKHCVDFHKDVFFPYLKEHRTEIAAVFNFGDMVDHRKFITYPVIKSLNEVYIQGMLETGIDTYSIPGNHDAYYKSTIELNAMVELLPPRSFQTFIQPQIIKMEGVRFLFLPWICQGNENECMEAIQTETADVVISHLELIGFDQYRGMPATHGMDPGIFKRFGKVYSGHYHHPSEQGNIRYLCAPYQMNWNDYDCPRGFHVFETTTKELTFVPNPVEVFKRIEYDDSGKTAKQILKEDFSQFENKIVKLVIHKRDNKKAYDLYMDQVEKAGVSDIQIIEPNVVTSIDSKVEVDQVNKSTLEIILDSVEEFDDDTDKDNLSFLLKNLYEDAMRTMEI